MTIAVNLKIDVSKIDKNKLFKGSKGTYLDATVFIDDKEDQYGNNGMITQAVTKEEKQNGVKGNILGNCKIFWRDDNQQAPQQQYQPQQAPQQQYQPQQATQQHQQAPQPQNNTGGKWNPDDFDDSVSF